MATFLTQKGNLGLKKLSRDQIVEMLPPPITNESLASDLGALIFCSRPLFVFRFIFFYFKFCFYG
jgi:hypothetical protein